MIAVALGHPRVHLRRVQSTNLYARRLAADGAPHGTLVTAAEQSQGRGRQGRSWVSPPGRSLLMSLVLREPPPLLSLRAGLAVARTVEEMLTLTDPGLGSRDSCETAVAQAAHPTDRRALIKWPNDVLLDGRKVAGILVESRPGAGWAVLGIGINVAVRAEAFDPELRGRAAGLGLTPAAIEPTLAALLSQLERVLAAATADRALAELRDRDALRARRISWADGARSGIAEGVGADGRLLVREDPDGVLTALEAGEVHLV